MKHRSLTLFGTLGFAALLALAGCTPAESEAAPEPNASAPVESGDSESSGPPSGNEVVTAPFESTVPEDVADVFSPLEGEWFYQSVENRVTAVANAYNQEMLLSFVAEKLNEGWEHQFDPQLTETGYVASMTNEEGDSLTVVGLVSGTTDESGGDNAPASVITFDRVA